MQSSETESPWLNLDNSKFYRHMRLEDFVGYAKAGGVSKGEDVCQIKKYTDSAKSVLELGAGYGRVIESLIKLNFKGSITAIERDQNYFDHCRKKYGERANIIHADLLGWNPAEKFDLILWMWTSVAEFNLKEQKLMFGKLFSLLTPGGTMVLDNLMIKHKPKVCSFSDGKNNIVNNGADDKLYVPSNNEIKIYALAAGFKEPKINHYTAANGINRINYIFEKN